MATNYDLQQTGEQVQQILNSAPEMEERTKDTTVININAMSDSEDTYTLETAIAALDAYEEANEVIYRKSGLVLTYKTDTDTWESKQFLGEVDDFEDESLWDDFGSGKVEVDDELDDESENPVQNKVIKVALAAKKAIVSVIQTTTSPDSGGTNIITVTYDDADTDTFQVKNGEAGDDGKSAYQLYLDTVPEGETPMTEAQWLASLKGEKGDKGVQGDTLVVDGQNTYKLYHELGQNNDGAVDQKTLTDELIKLSQGGTEWKDIGITRFAECKGLIGGDNSDTFVQVTNANYGHRVIHRPSNVEYIRITAASTDKTSAFFLSDYSVPTQNNQQASVIGERIVIQTNTTLTIKIPDTCKYICFHSKSASSTFTPSKVELAYPIEEEAKDLRFDAPFFTESIRERFPNYNGIILGCTYLNDGTSRKHFVFIRDKKASYLRVTARSDSAAAILFLKSYTQPTSGNMLAAVCDSVAGSISVPASSTLDIPIPDDCNYIVVNRHTSNTAWMPASISCGYSDAESVDTKKDVQLRNALSNVALSIIGDSISTYKGYIPWGNPQYTGENTTYGITSVNQTWWKMFADEVGIKRIQDMSQSGGMATKRSGSSGSYAYQSFYERALLLEKCCGFVIVALGANDSGNSVALGDYDYNTAISSLSDTQFRPAFIRGIKQIQQTNPNAKILIFSTTSSTDYAESERTIAEHYGLMYLNMRDYFSSADYSPATGDVHPDVMEMRNIFYGLMAYLKEQNLDGTIKDEERGTRLTYDVVTGSIDTSTGMLSNTTDTNRSATSYIDVQGYDKLLIKRGTLVQNFPVACYGNNNYNFLGTSSEQDGVVELLDGTCYVRRSLSTYGANDDSFRIYGIKKEDDTEHPVSVDDSSIGVDLEFSDENNKTLAAFYEGHVKTKKFDSKEVVKSIAKISEEIAPVYGGYIHAKFSDFKNTNNTDDEAIADLLAFCASAESRVITIDTDITISKAILLPSNTTVIIDGVTIQQADYAFDNVFRGANVPLTFTGDDEDDFLAATDKTDWTTYLAVVPDTVEQIENIKIIGKNGAKIVGCDTNATIFHPFSNSTQTLVGDYFGARTHQINFTNAQNIEICGIEFTKTRGWCITFDVCRYIKVHDLSIISNVKNGDGIDFRYGCKNAEVYNIDGYTSDDLIACTCIPSDNRDVVDTTKQIMFKSQFGCKQFSAANVGQNVSEMYIENINVHDITFKGNNSFSTGGHGMICLAASTPNGGKVQNVSITNFKEVSGGGVKEAVIKVYTGYGEGYVAGALNSIRVNGAKAVTSTNVYMCNCTCANMWLNKLSGNRSISDNTGYTITNS